MNFREHLKEVSTDYITEVRNNTNDYYPTGVYVAVLPDEETENQIQQFQKDNLNHVEWNSEIHSTLIYSNKPNKDQIVHSSIVHNAIFDGYDLFGDDKDTLVMKLKCDSMMKRNQELTDKYGFISDYDSYKPHITLAYDVKNVDISKLPTYNGPINLHKEYSEDLDDDWKPE